MRRMIVAAVMAAALGLGIVATVVAVFSDQQFTAGSAAMAPEGVDLYICEPDATPGPACGSDDSGADEIIFEGEELATPGDVTIWDIRLLNAGPDLVWDIDAFDVVITETNDPGGDCDAIPTFEPWILGKDGDYLNDNHPYLGGVATGSMLAYADGPRWFVHVEPGDYEDLRLRVTPPIEAGNECYSNAWSVAIDWTAIDEGSH